MYDFEFVFLMSNPQCLDVIGMEVRAGVDWACTAAVTGLVWLASPATVLSPSGLQAARGRSEGR